MVNPSGQFHYNSIAPSGKPLGAFCFSTFNTGGAAERASDRSRLFADRILADSTLETSQLKTIYPLPYAMVRFKWPIVLLIIFPTFVLLAPIAIVTRSSTTPGSILISAPNLSTSAISAWPNAAHIGQMVTYTITITNSGDYSAAVRLIDTLPDGLSYVSGTLTYSFPPSTAVTFTGNVLMAQTKGFPGTPPSNSLYISDVATVTFATWAQTTGTITNAIQLEDQNHAYTITPTVVQVNPWIVWLPLMLHEKPIVTCSVFTPAFDKPALFIVARSREDALAHRNPFMLSQSPYRIMAVNAGMWQGEMLYSLQRTYATFQVVGAGNIISAEMLLTATYGVTTPQVIYAHQGLWGGPVNGYDITSEQWQAFTSTPLYTISITYAGLPIPVVIPIPTSAINPDGYTDLLLRAGAAEDNPVWDGTDYVSIEVTDPVQLKVCWKN